MYDEEVAGIEYDEDDLPAGYPDVWSLVIDYLRWWRLRAHGARAVSPPPPVLTPTEQLNARARQVKFFLKKGPTTDWQENRRIYNHHYEQTKRKR